MAISAPFPYRINPDVESRNPTGIFKLKFGLSGEKYFIYKGMKLATTVENLSKQIIREWNHPKDDSILLKVIEYLRRSRVTEMSVEVIKESDDHVDILLEEYQALQAAKDDTNCLNTRFVNNEYFPQWISQTAINEFHKRLQGVKEPAHYKNLHRFLSRNIEDPDLAQKVYEYVIKNFRAAGSRKKRNESLKAISKK